MCFSGPSAESMYQEKKKSFGPLPSLLMSRAKSGKKSIAKPVFRDVRMGSERRSLLNPYKGDS